MSNQQRFIVTEDPWLGEYAVYDRKMHRFLHSGNAQQSRLMCKKITTMDVSLPTWSLWLEGHPEGKPKEPYLQIQGMFD